MEISYHTINSKDYGGGFGFHEFIYIKMNGQWYYSDVERICLENNLAIRSNIYLMLPPSAQDYGFTVTYPSLPLANELYEKMYNDVLIFEYNSLYSPNYVEIMKLFDQRGMSNELISLIVDQQSLQSLLNEIVKYSSLNYTLHTKRFDGKTVTEVLVYIL